MCSRPSSLSVFVKGPGRIRQVPGEARRHWEKVIKTSQATIHELEFSSNFQFYVSFLLPCLELTMIEMYSTMRGISPLLACPGSLEGLAIECALRAVTPAAGVASAIASQFNINLRASSRHHRRHHRRHRQLGQPRPHRPHHMRMAPPPTAMVPAGNTRG
jgi:hypothetical protein